MAAALARAVLLCLALVLPAAAQDGLPVVIVYQDRLIEDSLAGRALRREEEETAAGLLQERREIERAFEAEERELVEKRRTMTREAFAALAEDFDTRVRAARQAQEEKAIALQRSIETNRKRFLDSLRPVLIEVMQRFGASVMMEGRSVVLSDPSLDVTGEVISRMDEIYRQRNPEDSP